MTTPAASLLRAMPLRPLQDADVPRMLTLQDEVLADLRSRHEERYIVPRSPDYMRQHMSTPHGAFGIAAKGGDMLVAQALYHTPHSFNVAYTGLPAIDGIADGARVSVMQGALVHPEWQGQGLMKQMLSHWLDWCMENDITHALARVEVSHATSREAFKKFGLQVVGTVIDARDDASVDVLVRQLR